MENIDHAEILRLLDKRLDAINDGDEAMRRYYEGRIDGHCLQNAIGDDELHIYCSICEVPVEDRYDAVGAYVRRTGERYA